MTSPSKTREAFARYRDANRERINARRRARYAENAAPTLEQNRTYRKRNAELLNKRRRERTYGTDGEALFLGQDGKCAICRIPMLRQNKHRRAAHLDHDHATGKVRGWLCHRCNTGLGLFSDSAALLGSALRYLRRG